MDPDIVVASVDRLRCLMHELLQRIEDMEDICQFVLKEVSDD